jgi:hypothetical protein
MALAQMIAEMRGAVPGYSALLARTHLREAWRDIRNMKGWSFQLGNGGFGTPGLTNAGSVAVTFGSATVVGDTQASTAWNIASIPNSLITQQQFRVGQGTIYNIIAFDGVSTITLDRPYFDTQAGSGLGYSIYQCYYPVPFIDFQAWESTVDINNAIDLCCGAARKYREMADMFDPQRQIFANPGTWIPYQVDNRPGSATFGFMMYELYPQPQAKFAYQTWFTRMGADLVNPTDTLPFPISEHIVKCLARVKAYEWAEANKDAQNPRGAGADFRFLMGAAAKEGAAQLKEIRSLDRDRVDMWYSVMSRVQGYGYATTFNPATGMVSSNNTFGGSW